MKNNILIITDYSAPYEGNFIESIKDLHDKAKIEGKEIFYLFPKRAQKIYWIKNLIEKFNFNIYFFKDDTFFDLYKNIKDIVKKQKIDILYTHFCRHKTQLAIKFFNLLHSKVKLVSHFHNHCKTSNNVIKKNFMKIAYKLYEGDLNIGCSKSVESSMPYNKRKTTFVDNAINFNRLDNCSVINQQTSNNKFVILMFGFDYYRKGVDIVIKAIKEINNPNFILKISLASNKEKVKNYICQEFECIPNFIEFLEPINNVGSYYKASDVFISAAREEGFCYSIVEAAYCKTKIISSDIPGVPKDIPGEYIFKSGDYKELKNVILEVYNNNVVDSKLDIAQKYVKENYDISKWSENIIKKLDTL